MCVVYCRIIKSNICKKLTTLTARALDKSVVLSNNIILLIIVCVFSRNIGTEAEIALQYARSKVFDDTIFQIIGGILRVTGKRSRNRAIVCLGLGRPRDYRLIVDGHNYDNGDYCAVSGCKLAPVIRPTDWT